MIKSEAVSRSRISNEVFIDSSATKTITDTMCLASKSNIQGYIQEIGLDPFGFLLFSDIQVYYRILDNLIKGGIFWSPK